VDFVWILSLGYRTSGIETTPLLFNKNADFLLFLIIPSKHLIPFGRPEVKDSIKVQTPRIEEDLNPRIFAPNAVHTQQDVCVVPVKIKLAHLFQLGQEAVHKY
jgi:hypothetical protein